MICPAGLFLEKSIARINKSYFRLDICADRVCRFCSGLKIDQATAFQTPSLPALMRPDSFIKILFNFSHLLLLSNYMHLGHDIFLFA